jgi:replicative DNA helicase
VLAVLLYRPERVADLELWLRAGDFADPQHAAVYTTIAGLRVAGELHPINAGASLRDPAARSAILDNVLAVQEALHTGRFTDTPLPHAGVRELLGAAPTDGPDLHVRYGQMVLESSARRRLQDWAVYFVQPVRAPQYGNDTREFSPIHDGLVNDVADLEQRSAQSTVSRDVAAFADLDEMDTPTLGGPLVVPAAAPAHKLVERAERDVLTAVLSDATSQHHQLLDRLEPGDFTASDRHAATWRAIQAVTHRGEAVNAITVAWEAERLPTEHGPALSAEELVDLAAAPAPDSLRRQTATIVRASLYHRLQHAGDHLDRTARDRSRSVDQILNEAQGVAEDLRDQASRLVGEHVSLATAHRITQQLDGSTATRQR